MARKNRDGRVAVRLLLLMVFLLLACSYQCEARALMRRSRRNTLLNALYKLNFIRTVEPMQLPSSSPPPANPTRSDGDAASLADATGGGGDGSSSPYCVNPPNAPSTSTPTPTPTTPPFTTTPSTPFAPDDQPPPLPPIGGFTPPSFEPSPPASSTPGFNPSTPGTAPPSPIFVVPSPPETGPGGGAGGGGVGGGEGGGGGGVGGGSGGEGGGGVGGGSSGGGGGGSSGGGGNSGGGGGGGGGGFLPPIVYPPPLAPPMAPGTGEALWCVAKPTVPDPIMQEAMDYACGSGAECGSIQPSGACYMPDTVLAHASYAFNSYWQMTKAAGGTCDFGGTATIVTRDPSNNILLLPSPSFCFFFFSSYHRMKYISFDTTLSV
uniref:X8 domain-containing protein n=1 Tax=Oryza punctata TaxID=4537 RepID=A0A0E0KV30_ORYPU